MDSKIEKLQEIAGMLKSGVINRDEFEIAKQNLINNRKLDNEQSLQGEVSKSQNDILEIDSLKEEITRINMQLNDLIKLTVLIDDNPQLKNSNKNGIDNVVVTNIKMAGDHAKSMYKIALSQLYIPLIWGLIYGFINGFFVERFKQNSDLDFLNQMNKYQNNVNVFFGIVELILIISFFRNFSWLVKKLQFVNQVNFGGYTTNRANSTLRKDDSESKIIYGFVILAILLFIRLSYYLTHN